MKYIYIIDYVFFIKSQIHVSLHSLDNFCNILQKYILQ